MVEIAKGKNIIIELVALTDADELGMRIAAFRMNGQIRRIPIRDQSIKVTKVSNRKAEGELEVGSPLQGKISEVKVKAGDKVEKDQTLFVIEAMKMESTISSPQAGKVKKVYLAAGELVSQDDLVIELE
jgi:pyruvate carboxylase